jgi:hypothetical protein
VTSSQLIEFFLIFNPDQAVGTLGDIWPHNDIPSVFLANSIHSVSLTKSLSNPHTQLATKPQLPSPVTPSPSPISLPLQPSFERTMSRSNLVRIRGFVHEVLRRSRTSGTVLLTALCYLEAIRSKVPLLRRSERDGTGARSEPDLTDRIIVQTLPEPSTGTWAPTSVWTQCRNTLPRPCITPHHPTRQQIPPSSALTP